MSKIIKIDDYEIEDLGIQELDVFDIEVESNHNFFANDILVHNSDYFQFDDLIKLMEKNNGAIFEDSTDVLDSFSEQYVQEWLKDIFDIHTSKMNADNYMVMKREVIAPKGCWRGIKKHYALIIKDEKGTRFEKPKLYLKGSQFVSTAIPEYCKIKYDEAIEMLIGSDHPTSSETKSAIIKFVEDFREEFNKRDIKELCQSISVNDIEKYVSGIENKTPIKGAPKQVKAALAYNNYIKKLGLIEQGYQELQSGSKIRLLPLKSGHNLGSWVDTFGFIDELPPKFDMRLIDYETLFKKNFSKYLTELFKELSLDWDLSEHKIVPLADDAF